MNKIFKLAAIALISPSLFTIFSARAVKANQFDVCLRRLIDSGVTTEEAQTGCATALLPRDLSSCVRNITKNTEITGSNALQNCYRVRRPIDMGNCVVSINKRAIAGYSQPSNQSQSEVENTDMDSTDLIDAPISMSENPESPLMLALTTCRESLLPARHSECVISLSHSPESTSPIEAMETCLKAEDFPRDLFPSY